MLARELFSSDERLALAELLFYGPEKELRVRELSRLAGASPALVSKTLSILRKENIVKGGRIDATLPSVKAIKAMLNIEKLGSAKIAIEARRIFGGCTGIGVYGSWANGTNSRDSDLDLWVRAERESDSAVAGLRELVRRKLGTEANIIVLTEKRLDEMREKDFVFYCALHNSFVLWGAGI